MIEESNTYLLAFVKGDLKEAKTMYEIANTQGEATRRRKWHEHN